MLESLPLFFHEVFPCYAWYIFGNIIEYNLILFKFGSFSFRNEQVMHNSVKLVYSDFRFTIQRNFFNSQVWFHRDLKIGGRIVHYVLNNFHSFQKKLSHGLRGQTNPFLKTVLFTDTVATGRQQFGKSFLPWFSWC